MEKERKSPNDMKYISKKELKLYNKILQYNVEIQNRRKMKFTPYEETVLSERTKTLIKAYQELGVLLFWQLADEIERLEQDFKDCI